MDKEEDPTQTCSNDDDWNYLLNKMHGLRALLLNAHLLLWCIHQSTIDGIYEMVMMFPCLLPLPCLFARMPINNISFISKLAPMYNFV